MEELLDSDVTASSFISAYNSPQKAMCDDHIENEENITPQSSDDLPRSNSCENITKFKCNNFSEKSTNHKDQPTNEESFQFQSLSLSEVQFEKNSFNNNEHFENNDERAGGDALPFSKNNGLPNQGKLLI